MRPPDGPLARRAAQNVESVQTEIAQEKAASLSRAPAYVLARKKPLRDDRVQRVATR